MRGIECECIVRVLEYAVFFFVYLNSDGIRRSYDAEVVFHGSAPFGLVTEPMAEKKLAGDKEKEEKEGVDNAVNVVSVEHGVFYLVEFFGQGIEVIEFGFHGF